MVTFSVPDTVPTSASVPMAMFLAPDAFRIASEPMPILSLPSAFQRAMLPSATLREPLLKFIDASPIETLLLHVVHEEESARLPIATLLEPIVSESNACVPTATFLLASCKIEDMAKCPTAVLSVLVEVRFPEFPKK